MTDFYNERGEFHFPAVFRMVRRGTVANYSAFGIAALCSFVTIPILIAKLGPEEFGIYTLAISLATLMQMPFSGLETGATQVVSNAPAASRLGTVRRLLRTAVPVTIVTCTVLCAGCVFAAWTIPARLVPHGLRNSFPLLVRAFSIAALGIPLRCAGNLTEGVCLGLFRFRTMALINAASNILQAAGVIAIVTTTGDLLTVMRFWAAMSVVAFTAQWIVAQSAARGVSLESGRGVLTNLVRQAGWLGAEAAINGAAGESDKIIVSLWASTAAVGYYAIAWRVASLLTALLGQYASVFVPIAAAADASGDRGSLKHVLLKSNWYALSLLLPIAAVLGVWAQPLLRLWIGGHAPDVAGLLRICLIYVAVMGAHQLSYSVLYGFNRAQTSTLISLQQTVVRVVFALLLVHRFGSFGVAAAVVASAIIGDAILRARVLLRLLSMPAKSWLLQLIFPAGTGALVLAVGFWFANLVPTFGWKLGLAAAAVGIFLWIARRSASLGTAEPRWKAVERGAGIS